MTEERAFPTDTEIVQKNWQTVLRICKCKEKTLTMRFLLISQKAWIKRAKWILK
ncbi:hypothetical protein [Serratia sp. 2C06]|uniref:hypothetical protein n=1 Tax=Serratia sp. 2C06 TaxID=3416180 RepID=UPI003CED798A